MLETKNIFFDNKKWEYVVKYRQQKHLYLKLKDEKIIVSAPFFVKSQVIEDFILVNLEKIKQKIHCQKSLHFKVNLGKNPYIYFLDQKLSIIIKHQNRLEIYLDDNYLTIHSKYYLSTTESCQYLNNKVNLFLKKTAYPLFQQRISYWEKITNLKVSSFNLRLMKTKWGVCFHQKQAITLNYKLIHFSLEVIDYVIIHELCHLMHPNHSLDFWQLVAIYCPSYKLCRKILKNSSVGIKYEKD